MLPCIKTIFFLGQKTNYSICLNGKVFNNKTNKFLKFNPKDKEGVNGFYLKFNISIGKKRHRLSFHRELLKAFMPVDNMDNLEVDHINGDHLDNRLENLQWLTKKENLDKRVWESKKIPF
jgi:hypothetical protein